MGKRSHSNWGLRLTTLALWTAAGASVVFWGLRWGGGDGTSVMVPLPATPAAVDSQALARALGAVAPEVSASAPVAPPSRWSLVGVLAGHTSGGGAALIAQDGQPAKPYRVGAKVDDGLVLQSLGRNQAKLGAERDGPTTMTLDIPLPKP